MQSQQRQKSAPMLQTFYSGSSLYTRSLYTCCGQCIETIRAISVLRGTDCCSRRSWRPWRHETTTQLAGRSLWDRMDPAALPCSPDHSQIATHRHTRAKTAVQSSTSTIHKLDTLNSTPDVEYIYTGRSLSSSRQISWLPLQVFLTEALIFIKPPAEVYRQAYVYSWVNIVAP